MPLKRSLLVAAVILLGSAWDFWRSGLRFGLLGVLVVAVLVGAALLRHKTKPFWFRMGTAFDALLGSIVAHMSR